MKFKGVIDTLPSVDLEVGNVYQASVSGLYNLNKIGDLLVCTAVDPVSWHVIPSGDETSGTVTSVSAGTGLAGGTITGSGSITLDGNYTANEFRNGLLTKELYVNSTDGHDSLTFKNADIYAGKLLLMKGTDLKSI